MPKKNEEFIANQKEPGYKDNNRGLYKKYKDDQGNYRSYKEKKENKKGNKGEKKVFFNFLGGNITVVIIIVVVVVVVEKTLANNENPKVNIVNTDQCKRTRGIVQSSVVVVEATFLKAAPLNFVLIFINETSGQLVRQSNESLISCLSAWSDVVPTLNGVIQPLPDLASSSRTVGKPGISGTILTRVSISLANLALHAEEHVSLVEEVIGSTDKVFITFHRRIRLDLGKHTSHQCPFVQCSVLFSCLVDQLREIQMSLLRNQLAYSRCVHI